VTAVSLLQGLFG